MTITHAALPPPSGPVPWTKQFAQEMREFYKLFLNIDLTDEQIHHISGVL